MRSLWRILALRWLGGDGSDALTADSAILEGLQYGGNWGHLKSSDDAVLGHQDGASTSPWQVMSVRQSELPAPPRRDGGVIELARTNPRR